MRVYKVCLGLVVVLLVALGLGATLRESDAAPRSSNSDVAYGRADSPSAVPTADSPSPISSGPDDSAVRAARADAAAKIAAARKSEADAKAAAAAAEAARDKAEAKAAKEADARAKAQAEAEAAKAAQREAEAAASATHTLSGDITVPDINGALVVQVGGYPGQPLSELTGDQLDRMSVFLDRIGAGKTYSCPLGSGGGFSDLTVGAQVVVENEGGLVLATSELRGGTLNKRGCVFHWQAVVPAAKFYRVSITHRGELTYSREQLERDGWRVTSKL